MRKIYLLLFTVFFVLANLANLSAQVFNVPAGNPNSTSVNDPLGSYYGFERTALIYTPQEIGAAGTINSIGFYLNSLSGAGNATDVRIYIKQRNDLFTAATTYANEIAGATLVYGPTTITSASLVAGQWNTITLATNFLYTANNNLEIIVETNYGGTGSGEGSTSKQFRASSLATNQYYQFWNSDNSAPGGTGTLSLSRPNVQLSFSNAPCASNSLAGGTTQSSIAAACANSVFTLYITAGTASIGSSLTYQWESSADGITWAPIDGATAGEAIVSQTAATYYRRKMTCSGTDAYSTTLQVNQNALADCYCHEGLTNGSVNDLDIITEVSLTNYTGGNYANTSTSNGTTNYDSYNNTPLDLAQQTTASLAITFGPDPFDLQHSAAWIDWNQNGLFESSENIALSSTYAAGGATVTYNFVIPATASLGTTRMRIRGGSDDPYLLNGACSPTDYGETEDYLVNITAPPPCITPANIGITALGPTTATITWSAPTPGPASGYEYEIRTSGAPGSGATGLAVSGSTAAGVTTANITGLIVNSSYSLYVRSACTAGSIYSLWGGPFKFQTPCSFITSFPFIETFETTSTTLSCWRTAQISGAVNWTYETGTENAIDNGGAITQAHGGTRNAAHWGDGTSSVARLISPAFNFSGIPAAGAELRFWYSNQAWVFDLNELRVYYRTSTFGPWTLIPGGEFINSSVDEWTEVTLPLPGSTTGEYYIAFEGTELFGYGVTIDDVWVGPVPTCKRPENVQALGITPASIEVSFDSPGNNFIVEYGAPGFTPGTGATAGGGTLVTGAASPIAITGLAANTAYDVYLRQVCTPNADYSDNVLAQTMTLCTPTNVPYVQDFNGVTLPNIPACTSIQDLNGKPGWETVAPPANWGFPGNALRYSYSPDKPADDWFYTQGINLVAGTTYELDYKYGTTDILYPEKLKVAYGTKATAASMTTVLMDHPNITANPAPPLAKLQRLSFTPAASGVYYFGFHAYSDADQFRLYLDSIHVKILPVVDIAISAVGTLPNCSGNNVIQVTLNNNNLTLLDFAAHPVTVTASLTGGATTSFNTVINTGTLAAGAAMVVSLPAYNFIAGNYNMTLTATSPDDPETGNNSAVRTYTVNQIPVAPIITPSAPVICAGAVAQLNTQFTTTGSPKITWSPNTNLYINAAANQVYPAGFDATGIWAKPAATTTYTVTSTDMASGCTNTANVTVTVNNSTAVTIATVPPATICVNDPGFTLLASPADGVWTGVGVSGGNTFVPSLTSPGSYTLTYTLTNAANCVSSASIVAKVQDCPERRRLLRDDAVILYPNPGNGQFNLRVNSTLYSDLTMKVYTSSGNLIRTQSLSRLSYGQIVPFDFSNLPGGTYMVHMIYDGGVKFSDKVFPMIIGR